MSGAIGILGGTFDPPHRAHVAMATTARRVIGLDRVYLAPAVLPPHKPGTGADAPTAAEHRLAMATLAAADEPDIDVYRDEAGAREPSYTVDLLRRFHETARGADLYFIVGADSFRDLPAWKDPEELLTRCTLVVFPREDIPVHTKAAGAVSAVVFESPRIDISSHDIRALVARGESIDGLVPDTVAAYIRDHGLYRSS